MLPGWDITLFEAPKLFWKEHFRSYFFNLKDCLIRNEFPSAYSVTSPQPKTAIYPNHSHQNPSSPSSQHTLQMYWYLYAPSLPGSPSLGPSPWRWEPVPWIQSLGNQQHQQQEQQCPVSAMVEQQRDWAKLRPLAACKFVLWRRNINAFIMLWIWRLSILNSTLNTRGA